MRYVCSFCNSHKGTNIAGLDPKTRKLARLFNPRRQKWARHFRWDGPLLIGRTPIGRTTIAVLNMNGPFLVELREGLIERRPLPAGVKACWERQGGASGCMQLQTGAVVGAARYVPATLESVSSYPSLCRSMDHPGSTHWQFRDWTTQPPLEARTADSGVARGMAEVRRSTVAPNGH